MYNENNITKYNKVYPKFSKKKFIIDQQLLQNIRNNTINYTSIVQ